MQSRFLYIILAIILVLLVSPFIRPFGVGGQLLTTTLTALIPLASGYALIEDRKRVVLIFLLAAPFVVLDVLSVYFTNMLLGITAVVFGTALYAYIIVLLVRRLLSITVVTADMIYCAVSIYLLIGIMWVGVYLVLEGVMPGSFEGISNIRDDLTYFSFVTLTTVGYGDMAPASTLVRRLAVIEAAMGSIYMAVIVAMIVGRYMSLQVETEQQKEA